MKRPIGSRARISKATRKARHRRLRIESLEGRAMLAGAPITGLGVAGDSLSDEYFEETYDYARNWVQLVSESGGVYAGERVVDSVPRRSGYAYNWALEGDDSSTLLNRGQHTSLAQQINQGLVSHAVLAIGQNDFSPETDAYLNIFLNDWSPAQIQAYSDQVVANVTTALTTLAATDVPIVLSNIVDYSAAPITREFYPVAGWRDRVSTVIDNVNARLATLANNLRVPWVDLNGLARLVFGTNQSPISSLKIGNVTITATGGVGPTNAFVGDQIHPHTVVQAQMANLFLKAFELGYGTPVDSFTEAETLALVGLPYGGANTLNVNFASFVHVPANVAPVLNNSGVVALPPVMQNDANPAGMSIQSLLAANGGFVTDANLGESKGIAVTAVNNASGVWQYSVNGGFTWGPLGSPTPATARLLGADANTKIRFVPNSGFSGSVVGGLTFRAWDQTLGVSGGNADATTGGGATAFSTASETVDVTVVIPFAAQGTLGDDTIVIQAIGSTQMQVMVNGNSQIINLAQFRDFFVDALGGNDLVYVINNWSLADDATLTPGGILMTSASYTVDLRNAETLVVYGNSSDKQTFTGSAGNDVFYGFPAAAIMTSGTLITTTVGFSQTVVQDTTGFDAAVLIDSTSHDEFTGRPSQSKLVGDNFTNTINGYDQVYVFCTGGFDDATVYDSTGSDIAYGLQSFSILSGPGFFYEMIGYRDVTMLASAGSDVAVIYDSAGDDYFQGWYMRSYIDGDSYSFNVTVQAFDVVYALAYGGGEDRTDLFDSPWSDQLFAAGSIATLFSKGAVIQAYYFEQVRGARGGFGTDSVHRSLVAFPLTLEGGWIEA